MTSRSWVDAITNESMLAGLDAREYRAWLAARSAVVNPVVPVFLHEFTHHWCFDSLVGSTLAGLYTRARERACLGDLGRHEVASAVTDDLIRYWAASYLLRPLSEGLALFAEYDFHPGEEKLLSPLYRAVLACFGLPSRREQEEHRGIVTDTLQLARRTPNFCDRKADLLAKPATPDDAYLLGYLAVKALWHNARARCKRFKDAELFLVFLRAWFYLDAGLVNAILDQGTHGVETANAIAGRLRHRLETFFTCDLESAVEEWDIGDKKGGYGMFAGLHVEQGDLDWANTLLSRLLDEHLDHVPDALDDQIITAAKVLRLNTLYNRDIFTVCEIEAREQVLFTPGETVLSIWDTSTDEASEVASWGECAPECRARLRTHAQFARVRRTIGGVLESTFREVARRPTFDIWRWHLQESGHPVAAEIWERAATIHLPESSQALVLPCLRRRGILALLEGDVDILTTIATIGVSNSLSIHRSDVYFLATILGLEQEQVEHAEREATVVHGMPLLLRQDDYLIALV